MDEFRPFHGDRVGAMNPYHVAKLMTSKEEQREAMDASLFRPLHLAAAQGKLAVVRAILDLQPWVDVRTNVRPRYLVNGTKKVQVRVSN